MAPRRRPKKRGETRMDAALDAMTPFGFPNKLVRRTVDQLLKVYGGKEGWVFIEDSAYTLLIDTLLEKQSNSEAQDGLIEEAKPGDGPNEASPAGCSNSILLPCSNMQTSDDSPLTNQAVDTASAASGTGNQLPIKSVDTVSATSVNSSELPIKPVDISSVTGEPGELFIKAAVDTFSATSRTPINAIAAENEADCQPAGNLASGEVREPKSSHLVGRLCYKRRRPCYGWISSDDDEEELIELPPATLSKVSRMLSNNGVN
ncbi:uncharacterized protein LOC113873175 [Abrus precatorius]|uniref:Uncharacterized protein LOC113873175 n=1 Tax=Abrus precatorius TaxID=3816 RepID=A0A8B8MGI4_ABRPR|nr:uncharacterized protein LOC113873175 [Abrus precatorius]XP_027366983.1 uncharacterized protein LOC113873175 [Abrus precatorius]